jgi:hypothetical protein
VRTRRATAIGIGLLCAAAALGCGHEEDWRSSPTVQRMGPRGPGEAPAQRPAAAAEEPAEEAAPAEAGNRPPRLRGVQVSPAPVIRGGADVTVVAHADDPDGDEIEYHYTWWVNGDEIDEAGPVLSTAKLRRGDTVQVRVVASDGRGDSAPMSSPLLTVENGPPQFVSQPSGAGPDGVFRYQARAEDPEGDTNLRFSLAKAPAGMSVTPLGGLVEWRPAPGQVGKHPVEVVVEDSSGARSTQSFELTIDAPPAAPAR